MAYPYYPYSPNYFSNPYPQVQQQQTQPIQPQQPMQYTPAPTYSWSNSSASSLVWVKGRMEADAYPVAPNGAVALWDQENPCVYLKKADASGKPTITVYDLVERVDKPIRPEQSYASKEDYNAVRGDLDSIKAEIKRMQGDLYGIAGKRKSSAKEQSEE